MRYPKIWRKFINSTAYFSGGLTCIMAAMLVMECILRYVFKSPTSWSLNVSMYMLCYMMFLGSAFAFQSQGHIAVDMIRDFADKHDKTGKRISRRALAILGYVLSGLYLVSLLYGLFKLAQRAIQFNAMTIQYPQIPQWAIYGPMIIGTVMMIITVIFMILDIISGGEEFI